jgi:hypothetical protein
VLGRKGRRVHRLARRGQLRGQRAPLALVLRTAASASVDVREGRWGGEPR